MESKTGNKEVLAELEQFVDALELSMSYCKPSFESYLKYYKLFRGVKPPAMDATFSNCWINIFQSIVLNRKAQLYDMVFSHPEYMSLKSDSPEYDLMVDPAQAWLRELLDEKIKIRSDALATLDSALIGGTGYRMPYVRYEKLNGRQTPIISSKNLSFFNVLPSPNGSIINPSDYHRDDAIDWLFVVDWWSEAKIEASKNLPHFNKSQIGKLLSKRESGETFEEDSYKDAFKSINGISYEGYGAQAGKVSRLPNSLKKRRLVHWFRRDKHIIVAEDAFVIYSGPLPMGEGIIPCSKYVVTPDVTNFHGISQIEMVEDVVMATIMNFNYRMDHLQGVMFPTTYVRDDLWRGKSKDDFIPRPYQVLDFPISVTDISKAIFHDRRPEVTQQAFMEEDKLKAWIQTVSGEMNSTGSYGDVVGNRTSGGVQTIANQLQARPRMEASILEETGFRPEVTMLLKLGDIHINDSKDIGRMGDGFVGVPGSASSSAWKQVSPLDITDKFTVIMHGVKHNADEAANFQKALAMYPMWNASESTDKFELNKQMDQIGKILPAPDKVFVPPAPQPAPSPARPSALAGGPGGAASSQDITQSQRSTQRENAPTAQRERMAF